MSHQRILQGITIKTPCSANWEEMRGNDQVRFCEHCELSVHDLSRLTPAKAYKMVHKSKGRLCLRIRRTPAGEVVTRPVYEKLHAITRRTSRIVAGAFTAVIGLSAAAHAQSSGTSTLEQDQPIAAASIKPVASGPSGWLTGTVLDQNEAVVPLATVRITNEQTGEEQSVTTNGDGVYRLWLASGYTYQTQVLSPGFAKATTNQIALVPGGETRNDVTLEVVAIQGAIAITRSYEHPLVMAASNNDLETVAELIRNGVNVNLVEADGTSALALAVNSGNFQMVRQLLAAGANVNVVDESGNTELFWLDDDSSPSIIALLVKYGANVNQTNENGDTPLIHAAVWDSEKLVPALVAAGANVNTQNQDGNTALMIAAKEGNAQTVKALLAAGAMFGLRNAAGEDAMSLALSTPHDDVVELLRAAGATDPAH